MHSTQLAKVEVIIYGFISLFASRKIVNPSKIMKKVV